LANAIKLASINSIQPFLMIYAEKAKKLPHIMTFSSKANTRCIFQQAHAAALPAPLLSLHLYLLLP